MIRRKIVHFFPFPTPRLLNFSLPCYRPFSTGKSNHYTLLGISPSATQAEIKAAYLQKAKQYHPDIQKDPKAAKDAEEIFKQINEAYSVLSDDIKKKDYDDYINTSSRSSSSSAGTYSERSSQQNDASDFQYPYEKFYGKASAPDVDEDYHRKFHEANKRSRMETEDSFLLRNLDMIIMSSLGVLLYLKWASVYNEDTPYMNGARIVKTENERLNPMDDDDPEVFDVPVPKFDHQRLNFRDCMQLNIEQLEALDRGGYILPKEFKERVMEYREIYHLSQPNKNPTIWDYHQRKNPLPSQQETYQGPKFSPNDLIAPQQSFIMSETRKEEQRPVKPWPKGLPKPDQNGNIGGNEAPKPQKVAEASRPKQDIVAPKPVERKVERTVVVDPAKVEEAEDALQYRIPRMRANMYNMDRNK